MKPEKSSIPAMPREHGQTEKSSSENWLRLLPGLRFLRGKAAVHWIWIVLMLAPLVTFAPIVFGGYTLTQSDVGTDSRLYGNLGVIPVMDPAGSALGDEPILFNWRREFSHGHIPILNMKNGLGASSAELPAASIFYIFNPLLLLLPTSSALSYDIFQLIHVYVFLIGFYLLLKHYVSDIAAAATSILVALSGLTFVTVNIGDYRNYVWAPLMMAGVVGLARRKNLRWSAATLVVATVAAGTAGNVQHFGATILATLVVYISEMSVHGPKTRAAKLAPLVFLGGAILIAAIAITPYFGSVHDGNLTVTNSADRSVRPYDLVWMFSWFMPRICGYYPYLFLHNRSYWPHSDLSTVAFLFLIAGFLYAWRQRQRRFHTPRLAACFVIPVVMACGLIKVHHFRFLDFFAAIPFVQQFFFVKYHHYIFVLAAIPIAAGLQFIIDLPAVERRRFVLRAAGIVVGVIVLAVLYLWWRPDYSFREVPTPVVEAVFVMDYGMAVGVFLAATALLYWMPRHWEKWLLGVFVAQSLCLLPFGFHGRRLANKTTYAGHVESFSDSGKRLMIHETANSNLFFGVESIGAFDPTINTRYRDFIHTFFRVAGPDIYYDPLDAEISEVQIRALQLVGVSGIFGYTVEASPLVRRLGARAVEILEPLPRVFVISNETYRGIGGFPVSRESVAGVLTRIRRDLRSIPQPTNIWVKNETLHFTPPLNSKGVLVANQAYSTNWTYRGARPSPFLHLWPAWQLQSGPGSEETVTCWPAGLTVGLLLIICGLIAVSAAYRLFCAEKGGGEEGGGRPQGSSVQSYTAG